ncbi:hypothetical protein [Pontibacter sp. H249]|uniref:hypothetical protein n=1 Tax=Pontibacter sp. H249 TaxID=3133420 RepID=UPI0030C6120C
MLTDKELEEIRRKMLELEEEPPLAGWQRVQAEVQPKNNRRPFWWLLSLLVLLTAGLAITQLTPTEQKDDTAGSIEIGSVAPDATEDKYTPKDQKTRSVPAPVPVIAEKSKTKQVQESIIASSGPVLQKQPVSIADEPLVVISGKVIPAAPETALLPATPVTLIMLTDSAKRAKPELLNRVPVQIVHGVTGKERETISAEESTVAEARAGDESLVSDEKEQPKSILADTAAHKPVKEKRKAPQQPVVHSKNEWTAGIYVAPRYAFRKFVPNTTDDIMITGIRSANQLDPERMGYEFGATYSRVLVPGLFLEGGLSWLQLKENVTYTLTKGVIDTLTVRQSGNGQVVVESRLLSEERKLVSSYAYGGIRLGATYYFLQTQSRRLNLTVAGGANLLVKGTTRQFVNGEWIETVVFPSKENILEQSNYNLQLGVGYNVSVLGNYELSLMPTMSYFLGSTFKEREPLGLKPYSLGVNVQLKRRFNR